MKFSIFTAVTAGLVAAAPSKRSTAGPLDVAVLGGATFQVHQVANTNYRTLHRGPRALGAAYQKYGKEIPAELLQILQRILIELGITVPSGGKGVNGGNGVNGGAGSLDGNDTAEGDQGKLQSQRVRYFERAECVLTAEQERSRPSPSCLISSTSPRSKSVPRPSRSCSTSTLGPRICGCSAPRLPRTR